MAKGLDPRSVETAGAHRLPDGYEDYPPRWRVLDELKSDRRGVDRFMAVFYRGPGFARRFGARYRFAKSVQEVVLTGYASADTRAGYSALTRLAFTYSAFETMLALIRVSRKSVHTILKGYPLDRWLKELRSIDPKGGLFSFVLPRLKPTHEITNVRQFLSGSPCDVTALAAALRHIFFHGELTPNAGGCDPRIVSQICEHLRAALFAIMDSEIESRLASLDRLPTRAAPVPARS